VASASWRRKGGRGGGDAPVLGRKVAAVACLGREKVGAGVGRAGREAEAQDEWRWSGRSGGLGQKGGPGQFGCSC
jgi:hypothetical protein